LAEPLPEEELEVPSDEAAKKLQELLG